MLRLLRRKSDVDTAIADGDFDTAIDLLRTRMFEEPNRAVAWQIRIADTLLLAQREAEAVHELISAAGALEQDGRPLQAIALYGRALDLDPDSEPVRDLLAGIAGGHLADTRDYTTGAFLGASARWRQRMPLFSDFSLPELLDVVRVVQFTEYAAGAVIFNHSDSPQGLYAIASGEVVLSDSAAAPDTTAATADRTSCTDGTFFGRLGRTGGPGFGVQAMTTRHSQILCLRRDDFEIIALSHPRIWTVVEEFQQQLGL